MTRPCTIDSLPGPRGWPLVGNALQIDPYRAYQILKDWSGEYGSIYRFSIGSQTVVVLSDVEEINGILRQRPHSYRRWKRIEELCVEIGADGVFIAEQERWRQHRKVVTYALSRRAIAPLFERLQLVTGRLLRIWSRAAEFDQPHDLTRCIAAYTTDVVSGLVFGEDLNTLEGRQERLLEHIKTVVQTFARRQAAPLPYWRYIKLSADRETDHALAEIRRVIGEFIAGAHKNLRLFPERVDHPTNIIESLVAAQQREGAERFSDSEVIGNVMTLLFAGEDTTANTLAWIVHFLTLYPDIQHKLHNEVRHVLGDSLLPDTIDMLERLPYLEAVAFEAMRLKPVLPIISLEPIHDNSVMGISIPAGTPLALLVGQMGEQAGCFTDPQTFRPDRWLAPHAADLPLHDARGYLPFGSGARLCPGKFLAMLEIKMALATLARHFTVSRAPAAPPVKEQFTLTLAPSTVLIHLNKI